MWKNNNRFKKLKLKKEKKRENTVLQEQRFITTIKNVTEEKKKLKSLIRFHSANKIDNYYRGGIKRKEEIQKNLQSRSKNENN